jgi:queuine tRNA-ribosyltransferase
MFEILETKGKARLGKITTMHGEIYTPAFGPDATRGLVKSIAPHELENLSGRLWAHPYVGPEIRNSEVGPTQRRASNELQFLLTNTYHMRSYPGDEFIREMGGIHKFMKWDLPILTDSGGFQVFSLINNNPQLKGKITENGAIFNNPINGERLELTPEIAIDIQFNLGSDIMVVLDDPKHPTNHTEMEASVHRTIEWARRCKAQFEKKLAELQSSTFNLEPSVNQRQPETVRISDSTEGLNRPLLFAVIQGGNDLKLRKYCVDELEKIGFDGYGYGGYPTDDEGKFPYDTLEYLASILPENKPRYAMGVGTPENMEKLIEMGWDLFDCVIPSRNARHGLCYTTNGEVKILNSKYKSDQSPLDPNLKSIASDYPKYYLHHLFKIQDALGGELLTIHNLKYFNYVMTKGFGK